MRRALVERLATLASPEVASRIVDDVCAKEGLEWVPEGGLILGLFVHGPLREETARVLGEDAADALMDDLVPMVRMNQSASDPDESQVRVTVRPSPRKTTLPPLATPVVPAPASPESMHAMDGRALRILVASRDDERVEEIAAAMGERVRVQRVDDVIDLFDAASHVAGEDVVVVIDSAEASVQPSTLAAAHNDLPANAEVVLWGAREAESEELHAMVPESERWTKLGESTSPAELAFFLHYARQQRLRGDR